MLKALHCRPESAAVLSAAPLSPDGRLALPSDDVPHAAMPHASKETPSQTRAAFTRGPYGRPPPSWTRRIRIIEPDHRPLLRVARPDVVAVVCDQAVPREHRVDLRQL